MATRHLLSPLERQALSSFATRVRARFGERIANVTLFGSRARGTGRCDSDLDIAIGLDRATRTEKQELFDLAFDVGFEHGLTLSPLITTPQTCGNTPIARAIEQDGVAL
jgi:predicted nucleotidyltransferase